MDKLKLPVGKRNAKTLLEIVGDNRKINIDTLIKQILNMAKIGVIQIIPAERNGAAKYYLLSEME